ATLLDQQDRRRLTPTEQSQLKAFTAEHGRRLHECYLREIARQRGVSIEQAARQAQAEFEQVGPRHEAILADRRQARPTGAAADDRPHSGCRDYTVGGHWDEHTRTGASYPDEARQRRARRAGAAPVSPACRGVPQPAGRGRAALAGPATP